MLRRVLITTVAACGLWAVAAPGSATAQDVACADLPNPVYIQVGSTVLPLVRSLARELRDSSANPMTVVFTDGRSCQMVDAMATGASLTTNLSYVPSTEEDADWTPDMPPLPCRIDPEGHPLEMVHSDVFVESCSDTPLPDGIGSVQGPVLPFTFVVPPASSQVAITAEEAYFAWGFGAEGMAAPWTDESFLFTRPNSSGTKITFGANFGVPASRWKGEQLAKTGDVINAVTSSVNPEATLGIVGGANYDGNRDKLKSLAFRAFGQNLAFYPDSTATSFDKRNVRDGHYVLWGPAIFVTNVDADGEPTNPNIKYFLDLLRSRPTEPAADFDATGIIVDRGFIPDCAMGVSRDTQGGDLAPYRPAEPCGCFFESRVAESACTACTTDDECGAGSCVLGFCEGGE